MTDEKTTFHRVLIYGVVVAAVVVFLARRPFVTSELWRVLGGFPDLAIYSAWVEASPLPTRAVARVLLSHAIEDSRLAAEVEEHAERTALFLAAQTKANTALLVLYSPLGVLLAVAAAAASNSVRPTEAVSLDELRLELRWDGDLRPVLRVPEMPLPRAPWRGAEYGLPPGDVVAYRRLLGIAREKGHRSRELAMALAEEDLARASGLRRLLRADLAPGDVTGLTTRQLERYDNAWKWLPEPGEESWLVRIVRTARARLVLGGTSDRKTLWPLLKNGGVDPSLLRVREELRAAGYLTPLNERLLGILAAFPEWPASVNHHDAGDGGLIRHKVSVIREGLAMLPEVPEADRPAFMATIVAHDLGKVVSYRKRAGVWVAVDAMHAQNTALIVAGLLELQIEHGPLERG